MFVTVVWIFVTVVRMFVTVGRLFVTVVRIFVTVVNLFVCVRGSGQHLYFFSISLFLSASFEVSTNFR